LKLLLDTRELLGWLGNSQSLRQTARRLIRELENTVFVSSVAIWGIWLAGAGRS
jgi:PIN domain nuclease of toxin-antitoxin system